MLSDTHLSMCQTTAKPNNFPRLIDYFGTLLAFSLKIIDWIYFQPTQWIESLIFYVRTLEFHQF